MSRDLSHLRESYQRDGLRRRDLAPDPVTQFVRWWDAWAATDPYDPAACVLSTTGEDGRPSGRFVLCREFDARGFVIYTNQTSRKGHDLAAHPFGALTFGWLELARQVRIEGPVTHVADADSDAYWATRPRGSQIGAWASDQSAVVADRGELDRNHADAAARFADPTVPVPRPSWWGGYRVGIDRMEFWQGQPDRLHDRFAYLRLDDPPGWEIERLAP